MASARTPARTPARAVRERRERIVLTILLLALTLLAFGTGASALFTASTSAPTSVTSGRLVLDLGADGTPANRLSVDATDIAPGDTISRTVDLVNNGTLDLSELTLTTTASSSSLLDADPADGLQMTVQSCSAPWTEGGTAPGYDYTCGGAFTTLVASRPVIGTDLDLSGSAAMTAGETAHLMIRLVLPESAGNEFQGLTSTVTYTFDGVQRTATSR